MLCFQNSPAPKCNPFLTPQFPLLRFFWRCMAMRATGRPTDGGGDKGRVSIAFVKACSSHCSRSARNFSCSYFSLYAIIVGFERERLFSRDELEVSFSIEIPEHPGGTRTVSDKSNLREGLGWGFGTC